MNELLLALQHDDIGELSKMLIFPFHPNYVLEITDEKIIDWRLTSKPPIISVAAFFSSTKCFNLLHILGANINILDNVK